MTEAKIERLERTLWELEQLGSELFDLGYITEGNAVQGIVYAIETDLQEAVEDK